MSIYFALLQLRCLTPRQIVRWFKQSTAYHMVKKSCKTKQSDFYEDENRKEVVKIHFSFKNYRTELCRLLRLGGINKVENGKCQDHDKERIFQM